MSAFLPEGSKTPSLQAPGVAQPSNPEVTDADLKLMQRVLGAAAQYPNMMPDAFTAYLFDYIQSQRLQIPIGQVFGFSQFVAQVATPILTQGTTTSATYTDLSDVAGPTLTGLGAGQYVLLFGGALQAAVAGHSANMSLSINGATPSDNDSIFSQAANLVSCAGFVVATLPLASNTVTAQYKSGTAGELTTSSYRRLQALRFAN